MADKARRQKTRGGLPLLIVLALLALLLAGALLSQRAALAAPAQPINFKHSLHAEEGISCLFCHPSALRSDVAGIPSVERCVGCHQWIRTESPEIQRVLGYWDRQEPIPWRAVVNMADFVYFSHQPHLAAGVNCETCHGDVGSMAAARPVVTMDMGWCLACHLEQPEEKVARLADCLACHQ